VETLTEYDRARYGRQVMIDGWGEAGQERLKDASVFVAGAGGLGSPVSVYLAIAGVGELHICDADTIELSNLNRQILHTEQRIGESKATSAAQTLGEQNPSIKIVPHSDYLSADNIAAVVGQPDIVVDCLDNYETRYLLNDYCLERGIPYVHGAVEGLLGQVTFLHPPQTPCLHCIFPQAPPRRLFPIVGATPGVIGCIQVLETLKYLVGIGSTLGGRLLLFDGTDMTFTPIQVRRRPSCPHCGHLG